jgi:hypothetical protein
MGLCEGLLQAGGRRWRLGRKAFFSEEMNQKTFVLMPRLYRRPSIPVLPEKRARSLTKFGSAISRLIILAQAAVGDLAAIRQWYGQAGSGKTAFHRLEAIARASNRNISYPIVTP